MAPILEHAHESAFLKIWSDLVLRHEREANPLKCSLKHEFRVIDNHRPVHRDRQFFLALLELPSIQLRRPMAEVDAPMVQQVTRLFRFWM